MFELEIRIDICGPAKGVKKLPTEFWKRRNEVCGLAFSQTHENPEEIQCQDLNQTYFLYKNSTEMLCPSHSKLLTISKGKKYDKEGGSNTFVSLHCQGEKDTFKVYYKFYSVSIIQDETVNVASDNYCGFKIERNRPEKEPFNATMLSDQLIPCTDGTLPNEELDLEQQLSMNTLVLYGLIVATFVTFILIVISISLQLKNSQLRDKIDTLQNEMTNFNINNRSFKENEIETRVDEKVSDPLVATHTGKADPSCCPQTAPTKVSDQPGKITKVKCKLYVLENLQYS